MKESAHFIVATAGHVDHGKSALVKVLTGTDPDRLPEEKARGITIDLGFAHLELAAPSTQTPSLMLGIVDVPGHEDFVKNMVAGVGSIDLALFVIAADDGWMPQTEEHLQILTYLGVHRAVVALTKFDLVQDEHRTIAAIEDQLRGTPFADAPIVPTSIVTGRGLDNLRAAIAHVLAGTPLPRDIGKPRLPVDRVFTLRGIGTVVTGTLADGTLRRGQNVAIQPSGKVARIRSIQSHNHDVELGVPGTRTALNLPDIAALDDIRRGDVITLAELGGPSDVLDIALEISPRANRSIKNGAHVHVHHGSANIRAKVILSRREELAPGEHALAQLKCETSVFSFAGDRFVLRDSAGQNTVAGGVVLDPDEGPDFLRSQAQLIFLRQRAKSPGEVTSFVTSQIARDMAVRRRQLLLKSSFSASDISESVSRLASERNLALVGDFLVDAAWWQLLCRRAGEAIDANHHAHPEESGLSLSDLRTSLEDGLPFADLFDFLVGDLCRSEFVKTGNTIRRATHQRLLHPPLQAAVATLRTTLADKPFDPPSRKHLAPDSVSLQALRFLIETGEAVEINEDVVLGSDSVKHMVDLISQYIRKNGTATVSQLRQELCCSRRVIVPLLEQLDRDGLTFRNGDTRRLRVK